MDKLLLVIGNKNYSSWSMRPWVALKEVGIPFREVVIPFYEDDYQERINQFSMAGKVPVLVHGEVVVWDSLAILEYVAEVFPDAGLLPAGRAARAVARSVAAELHSDFTELRVHLPFNVRKQAPETKRTAKVEADIGRICGLWHDCRTRFGAGGPLLFGTFTMVDAMFAPVVARFLTYGVDLDPSSQAYVKAVSSMTSYGEWMEDAAQEPWVIPFVDGGE